MDGAALVGGHGEAGLVDHGLQGTLSDVHGKLVIHLRQLRIVVGGQTGQLEAGVPADQLDHIFLIGGENHDIVGQTADHLAEQTGIQDDAPLLMDLGRDGGADTGLHIVAGQRQLGVALQQHTLQRGDGAFGSHGAGYGTDGLLQQRFFAGKFQHLVFNPFCKLQAYFSESKHKLIFFSNRSRRGHGMWKSPFFPVFPTVSFPPLFWKSGVYYPPFFPFSRCPLFFPVDSTGFVENLTACC